MKSIKKLCILFLLTGLFQLSCQKELTCPDCQAPISNAGPDQVITLPTDSLLLDGSLSKDPDGRIMGWLWTKISGPDSAAIIHPSDSITTVKSLTAGNYSFELKVTDEDGLYSKDTMHVSASSPQITACGDSNRLHVSAQLIPFGKLSQARVDIAVASIGNKILFAGGYIDVGGVAVPSSRVDIYDITTQSWSTAELSEARYTITVIAVGNKIFFGGGVIDNASKPVKTVDIYDATNNTWSVAKLSRGGYYMATATVGNKVFFAGGYQSLAGGANQNRSSIVDIYDLNTSTWSVAQLSEPRFNGISAVAAKDKVYFAGGAALSNNNYYASDKIDIYDNTTNSWSTSTLYEGKIGCAGISAGDKIYWAGGLTESYQTGKLSCVIEIKDVNAGSSIAYLSNPGAGQAFLKDGKIVFFRDVSTLFDIYDQTTGAWSIGVLPEVHDYDVRICVNNTIYEVGGDIVSSQVWKLEF